MVQKVGLGVNLFIRFYSNGYKKRDRVFFSLGLTYNYGNNTEKNRKMENVVSPLWVCEFLNY